MLLQGTLKEADKDEKFDENCPFQLIAKLLHPKYEEVCEVLGRKLPFLVTKGGKKSFQTSFTVMKSTN